MTFSELVIVGRGPSLLWGGGIPGLVAMDSKIKTAKQVMGYKPVSYTTPMFLHRFLPQGLSLI